MIIKTRFFGLLFAKWNTVKQQWHTCNKKRNFVKILKSKFKFVILFDNWKKSRGGQNVKFHYYNRPFFSLHRKYLFSSSLLRHHYIKTVFLVHHYYDKERLSMFWFYLWHQKRSQHRKSKYQLPMVYYLWLPRPVGG